jgi:hypothetical protein
MKNISRSMPTSGIALTKPTITTNKSLSDSRRIRIATDLAFCSMQHERAPHERAAMASPEIDPALWSATQRWLDDLDCDITYTDVEPDAPPTELDIDDRPHDLDDAATAPDPIPAPDTAAGTKSTPGFNRALAASFAAATVLATVAVTTVLLTMRSDPQAAGETEGPTTQLSVVPAPPTSTMTDPSVDAPLPYTASASCPLGSTAAQAVAEGDPARAWVCVRGGVDGQVLHLDLGRTMVITAVSITPGWVGTDSSGADQWSAHRVVTRVQWIFNDDAHTVVTQTTGNVRGEAVQPIPHRGVLASTITAIVLETSRAPADPTPTTAAPPAGGLLDTVLGPPLSAPSNTPPPPNDFGLNDTQPSDPAANTFAVSSVKILGHPPQ